MNFIKLFFISIIALGVVVLAISALLPSRVRISRAIDIHAPAGLINEKVGRLENWEIWNAYVINMKEKKIFHDSIKGNQLTIKLIANEEQTVSTIWRQNDGKTYESVFNFITHDSITTVQWYFDFSFKWYPWEKFSSIVYDAQLGPPMQQSLSRLKELVENVH